MKIFQKDKSEDEIKQEIREYFGLRIDMKLFTNPCGNGWVGVAGGSNGGNVLIKNARRQIYGLTPGSSDLIGWLTVNGRAVFVALEVKTRIGRPTVDQVNFIEAVKKAGGIAGIVRSVDDVRQLINSYLLIEGTHDG